MINSCHSIIVVSFTFVQHSSLNGSLSTMEKCTLILGIIKVIKKNTKILKFGFMAINILKTGDFASESKYP